MAIVLNRPEVDRLSEAVGALRERQYDGAPLQLPGVWSRTTTGAARWRR
ncbi:hypothetical protein [Streptomyces gelaticus]|nr:hypothetical protein [Streptomyces gelaticus]